MSHHTPRMTSVISDLFYTKCTKLIFMIITYLASQPILNRPIFKIQTLADSYLRTAYDVWVFNLTNLASKPKMQNFVLAEI